MPPCPMSLRPHCPDTGYAEGLTEGMAEDEDSRNYYCEVIMDEAGKMNKMVKQLLTLTALEFGNDMPVMERFDITALILGASWHQPASCCSKKLSPGCI